MISTCLVKTFLQKLNHSIIHRYGEMTPINTALVYGRETKQIYSKIFPSMHIRIACAHFFYFFKDGYFLLIKHEECELKKLR